jgi:hypothetical protein
MSTDRTWNRRSVWITVAVVAVILAAVVAAAIYMGSSSPKPTVAPNTPAIDQALAVAGFLKAYVRDDPATMERLVTARNIPWDAPPPTLPPGVSTDTVASFIEPFREGDQIVIGNPLVIEVRMAGDGKEPTGTVTARISTRKQPTRTVRIGLVLSGGRWLVDTVDGVAAVKAVKALTG